MSSRPHMAVHGCRSPRIKSPVCLVIADLVARGSHVAGGHHALQLRGLNGCILQSHLCEARSPHRPLHSCEIAPFRALPKDFPSRAWPEAVGCVVLAAECVRDWEARDSDFVFFLQETSFID
jgi:hypothetical protein